MQVPHVYHGDQPTNFFRTSQRQTLEQVVVLFEDVGTLLKCGNPKIDGDRLKIGLKSLTAHVYANKSRTKCRMTLLFVSMDRYDPKEVCKYHKYIMETNKIFSDQSKADTRPNAGTFWGCWDFVKVWESQNRRRSTLNRVESLTAHVYANKNRTKCCTTLLFVSMDSCDPKEVCKYHKYAMETNRKFFRTTQRQTLDQILVLFQPDSKSILGFPNFDKVPTSSKSTRICSSVCLWLVRKNLLLVSMVYLWYLHTSLGSHLSIDTNSKVVRHLVRLLLA